jgi:hypothetical protein
MLNTPALIFVAPVYVFAPLNVRVAAVAFVNEPAPFIVPTLVPELTVSAVDSLTFSEPSFNVAMLAVVPFKFNVPPLTVVRVATPPTVVTPPLTAPEFNVPAFTTPPLISDVSRFATFTTPSPIPPALMIALLPKRVFPTPLNPARVIVPLVALKFIALAVVFVLPTVDSDSPLPLIVAKPLALTMSAALPL